MKLPNAKPERTKNNCYDLRGEAFVKAKTKNFPRKDLEISSRKHRLSLYLALDENETNMMKG